METPDSPDQDHNDSIVRFAHDMAEVRKRSGLSLDELHHATKIPRGLLQEFEETGLVDNTLFNRVYLRSFVSTYASTVGVDRNLALIALEKAFEGLYEGEVSPLQLDADDARQTTGRSGGEAYDAPGSQKPQEEGPRHSERADARDVSGPDRAAPNDPRPDTTSERQPRPDAAEDRPDGDSSSRPSNPDRGPYEPGVARRFRFEPIRPETPRQTPTGEPDADSNKRHTEISTAIRDYREPTPQKGVIIPPNRLKTALLILLVVAVTVSAAILAFKLSSNSQTANDSSSAAQLQGGSQPSIVQARPPDPLPAAVPPPVIADTIIVTVVATEGPLDPIRVQLDRDLRRPYWIDAGDSMNFAMTNQIVVDTLLDVATIKLEGLPYPPALYRSRQRLVITRDSVLHFVGTLRSR